MFPNGYNLSLLKIYKQGILQKLFSKELRFKNENGKDFSKEVRRAFKFEILDNNKVIFSKKGFN